MGCGASTQVGSNNLLRGLTFLPRDDPNTVKRNKEIKLNRDFYYKWQYKVPEIPPYLPGIPVVEKNDATAAHKMQTFDLFLDNTVKISLNQTIDFFKGIVSDTKPYEQYTDIFHGATVARPAVWQDWMKDEEFARQRMVGCNPTLIRRVNPGSVMLQKAPITDALIKPVVPPGYTIDRLVAEGRLYGCDYEPISKIIDKCPAERNTTAPVAFFFTDPRVGNDLRPLAIQLAQAHTDTTPIFTPADPPGLWLVAKIHVQVADANLHEVEAHLYATHIVMEAVYVSMRRNLHQSHPVAAWLQENFFFTIHINHSARQRLIVPDGPVPVLMSIGYGGTVAMMQYAAKTWNWERYNIPYNIQRRGLDNVEAMPTNYWRDDALRVWDVMRKFSDAMVDCMYMSDEDITADTELQAWIKELVSPVGETGCGFRGLPIDPATKTMTTIAQLKLFCCEVLYAASAGHSAVNNGQYDYLAFIPNSPGTFKIPPPKNKAKDYSHVEISGAMPNGEKTVMQIGFVSMLSAPTTDPIGSYDGNVWKRPDIGHCLQQFHRDLTHLSDDIRARNKKVPHPYVYLDPKQIAQGIAI